MSNIILYNGITVIQRDSTNNITSHESGGSLPPCRDVSINYFGVKPYAMVMLAYRRATTRSLVVVNLAEREHVILTVYRCDKVRLDEIISEMELFAELTDGKISFDEPYRRLEFDYREDRRGA